MKKLFGKVKHKKLAITGIIVGALVLIIIVVSVIGSMQPIPVQATAPLKGSIEESLNLSGTVQSAETLTYYADFDAKVGETVSLGAMVKNGDAIVKYDEKSLSDALEIATLQDTIDSGEYKEMKSAGTITASANVDVAKMSLGELKNGIALYEQYIKDQTRAMEEKEQEIKTTLAARSRQIAEGDIDCDPGEAMGQLEYDQGTWEYQKDYKDMRYALEDAKFILEQMQKRASEIEGDKAAGKYNMLTKEGRAARDAEFQLKDINNKKTIEKINDAANGITAAFNGVITEMNAKSGMSIAKGEPLFVLSSLDDVYVEVSLSKYELEKMEVGQKAELTISGNKYEGEVIEIDSVATLNSNNTPVVKGKVKVLNPDDKVVLGVEAKAYIHGRNHEDTMYLPIACVNADTDGDFVYVIEDGSVARRNVTCGISSDENIEIIEGLSDSDTVISEMFNGISEGMAVAPIMSAAE